MTTLHRATPEQWAQVESYASDDVCSPTCLLELRDRLAVVEQRISELDKGRWQTLADIPIGPRPHFDSLGNALTALNLRQQDTEPAPPARSLVEVVQRAIEREQGPYRSEWGLEARAAILAVAEWLDSNAAPQRFPLTARCLRKEVERG